MDHLLDALAGAIDRARKDRKACSEDGCDRPVFCKGRCRSHDNKARYAADPERHRARAKEWARNNPDKVQARNARRDPQQIRDIAKARYWADRVAGVVKSANHRAQQMGAPGLLTADGVRARFAYFGDRCWICQRPGADSIDHVIPLGAGGPNFNSNIRPAHLGCNAGRSWEGRR